MSDLALPRRRVLRGVAAGVATGLASTATADSSDRHIVGVDSDAGFDVARRRADGVYRELDFGRIGKAVAGRFSGDALDALENDPDVRYVEKDGTMHAFAQTLPWGVDRVDADVAHAYDETGFGADVAILDTGIDDDHEDLLVNLGVGKDFTGTGSWDDDDGHGTHCAGIADAADNLVGVVGVATEATLHAVKVLDENGAGTYSDVAAGIQWTADQGYDVASMSFGDSSGSSTLKDACEYAQGNGVLLVAAAGSDGDVGYPAAYDEVVAVSATDGNDDLATFSATGPEIELAAPGEDVYSTNNDGGYVTRSGTSMACPHVSGAGGHLMANGHTNAEARQKLKDTAEDLGLSSDEQGAGLLDVEEAVLDCVDASKWPEGTGYDGYEHLTYVDVDGQATKTSGDDAYYDFTCPDVVYAQRGDSVDVTVEFDDGGYDGHYGNVFVDWYDEEDWSTATEIPLFSDVDDDSVTFRATVTVPTDAALGATLARVRLSWDEFKPPDATDEYGEVDDFTIYVE